MKALVFVTALAAVACGSSPSPVGPTAPIVPPGVKGVVVATNDGQPIADVTLTASGVVATSNGAGAFELPVGRGVMVALGGSSIIERTTTLQPQLDAFRADGFDLTFYRAFARNGFERPDALQPIRRWTRAPMLYIRTVDEAGEPIDRLTLDTVDAAMRGAAGGWSGGNFGLAGIEHGTETKEGVSGWITVKWPNPGGEFCGRAQVGVDGGWIELNYLFGVRCSCSGNVSRVAARTARHELGHAFGYYHTDMPSDLMYGIGRTACMADMAPSTRELQYSRYVYSRPVGNRDPDADPLGLQVRSAFDRVAPLIVD